MNEHSSKGTKQNPDTPGGRAYSTGMTTLAKQRKATPIDEHVGRRIRSRRNELRLNLETVAKAIGCSTQQLRKYETGENRASAGVLHRLGKALGVRANYFFVDSDFIQDDFEIPNLVPSDAHGAHASVGFAEDDGMEEGDAAVLRRAVSALEDENLRKAILALAAFVEAR